MTDKKDKALDEAILALKEAREQLGGLPPLDELILNCIEARKQKFQRLDNKDCEEIIELYNKEKLHLLGLISVVEQRIMEKNK